MKPVYFKNNGLSFRQFKTECNNILVCTKRDTNELSPVGITAQLISDFENKVKNLDLLLTHAVEKAEVKKITLERNELINILKEDVDIIQSQLSIAFEKGTNAYDVIFSRSISGKKIAEFVNACAEFKNVLLLNADLAATYYVTAEKIADFSQKVEQLILLHEKKESAVKNFKTNAYERSKEREAVAKLLNYISSVAQSYWKRKNPVYYAQYNISRRSIAKKSALDNES